MEKWESYFHEPKSIEKLINTALIVVDTNVLLSAYQWRDLTVKEMLKTLEILAKNNRLRIPFQVLKEFSKNRPKEIVKRINEIESIISTLQPQKPLNQIVPMMEGRENYQETQLILASYNNKIKEYKNGLMKIRDDLKYLFIHDKYLEELKEVIDKSYYYPLDSKTEDELMREAEKRFKSKTPPGYKDDSKSVNNAGDFLVWSSILTLDSDVVFISGDKKEDWVYSDKHKNSISARRELVEEFYLATGGKDFAHLSPKEFITLLNPSVSEEIKTDLSKNSISEIREDIIFDDFRAKKIMDILQKYAAMGLTFQHPKTSYIEVTFKLLDLSPISYESEWNEIDELLYSFYEYESVTTFEFTDMAFEIKDVILLKD